MLELCVSTKKDHTYFDRGRPLLIFLLRFERSADLGI